MTRTPILLSFEEYLNHDDGTDTRYELANGELIEMPPATRRHRRIAKFLEKLFEREIERLRLPWETGRGDVEIATQRATQTRRPDVVVFERNELDPDEVDILTTPPLLVVEVVSPGEKNAERDYVTKEAEYSEFGVREYWTADRGAETPNITVRTLVGDKYETRIFTGNQQIVSRVFPELVLTAEQILSA